MGTKHFAALHAFENLLPPPPLSTCWVEGSVKLAVQLLLQVADLLIGEILQIPPVVSLHGLSVYAAVCFPTSEVAVFQWQVK